MARQLRKLLVAGAFVLSACGGGGSSAETTADLTTVAPITTAPTTTPTTTAPPSVSPMANPIDQGVEAKIGTADYGAISAATAMAAGDRVRTDATGFAEISYADGSITRLDADTEFEIVSVAEMAGVSTTRTHLETGRVWNRMQSLGSEAEFSIDTSVATASLRGAAFLIECRVVGSCTFTVLEGAIDIIIDDVSALVLEAPGSVKVDASGASEPLQLPFDEAFGDPWVVDNSTRDELVGFSSGAQLYEEFGPAFGSLAGTFSGERTVVGNECLETPTCETKVEVGDVAPRSYTFSVDCTTGYPCLGQALTESSQDGVAIQVDVPLPFDGATYTWSISGSARQCEFEEAGPKYGEVDYLLDWTLTPSAAEIRDGKYVITQVTIAVVAVYMVTLDAPECEPLNARSFRQTATAVATRTT